MTGDGSILHMWSILQMIQMDRRLTYSVFCRYLFSWLGSDVAEATHSLLKAWPCRLPWRYHEVVLADDISVATGTGIQCDLVYLPSCKIHSRKPRGEGEGDYSA